MLKRTKSGKIIAATLVTALSTMALVGCGTKAESSNGGEEKKPVSTADFVTNTKPSDLKGRIEGNKAESGELTILGGFSSAETINGNPFDAAGPNWDMLPFLYDYLADFDAFPEREFKPSLLESYELEGSTLKMKLKEGLKWSDGETLDADDVLCNLYMTTGSSSMWRYIEKVEKVNDLEMVWEFNTAPDLLLNLIFNTAIKAPEHVFGKYAERYKVIAETGREFDENLGYYKFTPEALEQVKEIQKELVEYKPPVSEGVYSGPYKVSKVTSAECVMVENEHYRVDSNIDKLTLLQNAGDLGEIQGAFDVNSGGCSIDKMKELMGQYKDKMRVFYSPVMEQFGLTFNTSKYPMNIPEVRKAISCVIERDLVVTLQETGFWVGDPKNTGLLPALQEAYVDESFINSLDDYSFNLENAEEYLTSIGWKRNAQNMWEDDKGELVKLQVHSEGVNLMLEAISAMLNDFGLTTEFIPMESATYGEFMNNGEHMMGFQFIGNAGTYLHPWEAFNDIYNNFPHRLGLEKPEEGDFILEMPSTGEKINVTQDLIKLFGATDPAEITKYTEQFMQLTNELCLFFPVAEKSTTVRVYNEKLSFADAEQGGLLHTEYWQGTFPRILSKMMHQGEVWLTE